MHLKYSNGSKHATHLYSALHGVDANSLMRSVCEDAQRGHCTIGSRNKWRGLATECAGGAIPYSRSFSRALGVSQSLLHGGESTESTRAATPASLSRSLIEAWITSVAGHPVYVGDTPTVTPPSARSRT